MKCLLYKGKNVNIGSKYLLNLVHVILKLEAKNVLIQKTFLTIMNLQIGMFSPKSLQLVRDWYCGVQFHWNKVNTKDQNNLVILFLANSVLDKRLVL